MNTPSCPRSPTRQRTFATERLQLAIFLHATQRLRFSHCEASDRDGKVRFVFDDPQSIGDQAELDFDRGAEIAATVIFASQKFLRRQMSEALENRRNGIPYVNTTERPH